MCILLDPPALSVTIEYKLRNTSLGMFEQRICLKCGDLNAITACDKIINKQSREERL